jgi:hypothetical protein
LGSSIDSHRRGYIEGRNVNEAFRHFKTRAAFFILAAGAPTDAHRSNGDFPAAGVAGGE